jgi:hypothetical protein
MTTTHICPTCFGTGWATTAYARSNDPETSQQAAKRQESDPGLVRIGTKKADALEAFLSHPRTAQEAALWVHRNDDTIANIEGTRRRVSDLVRAGYLLDSGLRRENPGAGTPSIVWQITGKGIRVLHEAHEAHLAKRAS